MTDDGTQPTFDISQIDLSRDLTDAEIDTHTQQYAEKMNWYMRWARDNDEERNGVNHRKISGEADQLIQCSPLLIPKGLTLSMTAIGAEVAK